MCCSRLACIPVTVSLFATTPPLWILELKPFRRMLAAEPIPSSELHGHLSTLLKGDLMHQDAADISVGSSVSTAVNAGQMDELTDMRDLDEGRLPPDDTIHCERARIFA